MSSDVAGKQQKYNKIGARVYVPFEEFEEVSVTTIKLACTKFFAGQVDNGYMCDVFAGERDPSCSRMDQIPDKKVFYVRFIPVGDGEELSGSSGTDDNTTSFGNSSHCKKPRLSKSPVSLPSPEKAPERKSCYPKSLSAIDMLKLGREIFKRTTTIIDISQFEFENMTWCSVPQQAEFTIQSEPFGSGGFRQEYKATSISRGFEDKTWVVKKYLPQTVENIKKANQTVSGHTGQSIQGQFLARNFAKQLEEQVKAEKLQFGKTFEYKKVFLGETERGEWVTVEEFIPGECVKYINNNGDIVLTDSTLSSKAEALVHFSYVKSDGKLMLTDIQGAGYVLYDPEIATVEALDEQGKLQFSTGNLAKNAIETFFAFHKCNYYCRLLKIEKQGLAP